MKILSKRVSDSRFKGLIGRLLRVGVLDQSGEQRPNKVGTPQGSIVSPVLANIYLNEVLDQWFVEGHAKYTSVIVRYADDAVFFFKTKEEAEQFLADLEKRVVPFGLTLHPEKTRIIDFRNTENNHFDFLGFRIYWGTKRKFRKKPLKVKTQKKQMHKKIQEFDQWIKGNRSRMKLRDIWKLAKAKITGHYNYFGFWMNRAKLNHFYFEAMRSLFKWLNRRSQKASFNWEQFVNKASYHIPKPPLIHKLKPLGASIYV